MSDVQRHHEGDGDADPAELVEVPRGTLTGALSGDETALSACWGILAGIVTAADVARSLEAGQQIGVDRVIDGHRGGVLARRDVR